MAVREWASLQGALHEGATPRDPHVGFLETISPVTQAVLLAHDILQLAMQPITLNSRPFYLPLTSSLVLG